MLRQSLLAGAICCVGLTVSAQEIESSASFEARVDGVFAPWDSTNSPGCAVAVTQNGRVVYKQGYGMANLDHDVPIRADTVFHVASLSKQFTAAAIALLALDGDLSLDDPIRHHLPWAPDVADLITIRNLVHHNSGLRDQWSLLGMAGWRYSQDRITNDDVRYLIERQRDLNFAPGERFLWRRSVRCSRPGRGPHDPIRAGRRAGHSASCLDRRRGSGRRSGLEVGAARHRSGQPAGAGRRLYESGAPGHLPHRASPRGAGDPLAEARPE